MAWPDTSMFDSGAMEVPEAEDVIPNQSAGPVMIVGQRFTNPTTGAISVTVKDANGLEVVASAEVSQSGAPLIYEVPFEPLATPLTWFASAPGLIGHVWGKQ